MADLEETNRQLCAKLAESNQKADTSAKILDALRRKQQCETLYADGHVIEATQSLLEFAETTSEDVKTDPLINASLPCEYCHNEVEECSIPTIRLYGQMHHGTGKDWRRCIEGRK